jgi:hypothetical protein
MGKNGRLTKPRPSRAAEAIVAFFVPPACHEEVVGDLHERYRSPVHYGLDALSSVPLVIASRIRRTADPQVLLMHAFALYLSFVGAAWFQDQPFMRSQWGLLRLAVPVGVVLLGIILDDAYARPGRRAAMGLVRGPVLGLALALLSQSVFWAANAPVGVPRQILFYGCGMGLLLSSAIRQLFPPVADQLLAVNAPALWLKRGDASGEAPQFLIWLLQAVAVIVTIAVIGTWIVTPMLLGFIAYQLWKRV